MKNNNDGNNSKELIRLSNGCFVHPDILELVLFVLEERIPVLSADNVFTLKQIFGKKKWGLLDKVNQIDAGYCMVELVKKGEVPFKFAKGKGDNHRRYQLTSTKLGICIP